MQLKKIITSKEFTAMKTGITQRSIVSEIEAISNSYNSIIYHTINDLERLERGVIGIGDTDSIDFELERLEQVEQLKNVELLPTLTEQKNRCLQLWNYFDKLERQYLSE